MQRVDGDKQTPSFTRWKEGLSGGGNHERALSFDLDLVVTEFEALRSQLAVPCNHYGFRRPLSELFFSARKRIPHVLKSLDARSHRSQHQQQSLRIGILPLFPHIEVRSLNSIQRRKL